MRNNENMELKRIFDIIKSKAILIAILLIGFTVLGYAYSYYQVVPKYKSTATMLLIPNDTSDNKAITTTDLNLNSELIVTYSNIAKQSKVVRQVIQNLGLTMSEQELLDQMQVRILSSTYIIEISVANESPQLAMQITKELSNVFLNEIKQIYHLNNIGIIDEAKMPKTPYNINHIKDMAMFFGIGLVASGMLVMGIYIFDNTIKEEEEVEKYIKVKSLGKIPLNQNQKNEIVDRSNAKSYVTECINTIRTNILYMNSVKASKSILITSCTPREGKSWVSTNIATAFAETNKKVLLIDCDMRKGRQHKIFKISNEEGLSSYLYNMIGDLKKDAKLGKDYIQETQIPNLHILTNGPIPPNPSELIDSETMAELIKIAKTIYDVVIVDAPPCKLVTDSMILSRMVDSTILVANSQKTKIGDLKEVKKSIEAVGGKVIGAIVNQVKMAPKTYGNTYYYGHHSSENKCEIKERKIASVVDVIDEAMPKFKAKNKKEIVEEIHQDIQKPMLNAELETQGFGKNSEEQNGQLEEVINSLIDIKRQLKNNTIESKLKDKEKAEELERIISEKIEELSQNSSNTIKEELQNNSNRIKEELQNNSMAQELNKILQELETVKANFQVTKEDLEYTIKQGMLSKEEVEDIVKNEMISKETIANIVKEERITKAELEEIVNNGRINKEELESIIRENSISKETIEAIASGNGITKEELAEIINTGRVSKTEIEEIVNQARLNPEELENILTTKMLTGETVRNIVREENLNKEDVENILTTKMLTGETVRNIVREENLNKEDVENILTTKMLTGETVRNIVRQENLNKEDVENILTTKMLTGEAVRNIVREENLNKEDVEDILTTKMLTGEAVRNIVREENLSKEEIEAIVNKEKLTKQEMEILMKNENLNQKAIANMMKQELARINYVEQINQINEKMMNLQENYLELLNIIKTKQIDIEEPAGENVINMKNFKKQAEKKKRIYSIQNEMIPYEELEKTAICIIPLKTGPQDNNTPEELEGQVAIR